MTIRVSTITVTLNAQHFLPQCLASVASQQGDYLYEHIIVDGGSSDETLDIIMNHAEHDSRVRWISETDKGIADAMNKGLALARGDIVNFLHADDYLYDESVLASVCTAFETSSDISWLTGGLRHVSADGNVIDDVPVRNYTYNRLLRGNIILHPSTFITRKSIVAAGGYDLRWKYAMDYDLWLRLAEQSSPLCLARPLACFRVHSGSISSVRTADAFAEEKLIRKMKLIGKPILRSIYSVYDTIKEPLSVWKMRRRLAQAAVPEK